MKKRALNRLASTPWPIRRSSIPDALRVLLMEDDHGDGHEVEPVEPDHAGQVAILPFHGIVLQHPDQGWGRAVYTEWWGQTFDELVADPNISAIVATFDSPGGIVYGVQELADKVFEARGSKPMVAVANSQAASAALWIATAFPELYVTPGGEVGSHGVWTMHEDISGMLEEWGVNITLISAGEHKVEGNPFEPLDDEARAELQRGVDEVFETFTAALARNRGVSTEKVLSDFGQGRMFSASRAVEVGLADGVRTVDSVVLELSGGIAPPAPEPEPVDDDEPALEPRAAADGAAESRNLAAAMGAEVRAVADGGEEVLEGTGLRYGSLSRDMGGWQEVFEDGAFAESIAQDDLRVIWQHDPKCVFGRVRAGTARIWEEGGIQYRATPPEAQWARDAMASIRRGDVDQNSFRFIARKQRWERRDGIDTRVILEATLIEVGPQTNPAYEDTSVAVTGLAAWQESPTRAAAIAEEQAAAAASREIYERRGRLHEMTL